MLQTQPDIEALSERLLRIFPVLDAAQQRLSLALYRDLARGAPVSPSSLANRVGMHAETVIRQLRSWPGVYYDGEQRVVGFWGLAIAPMPHRLRIDSRELYAWCAWDTLFLPALLGVTAEVESACRASGAPVRLTVTPSEVESAEPAGLSVSFLLPEAEAMNANVITSFCHYVHFFNSREAAQPWLDEHPETFLLPLADAYEFGRRMNRARYGRALDVVRAENQRVE
jgi:alkylmercury lyase